MKPIGTATPQGTPVGLGMGKGRAYVDHGPAWLGKLLVNPPQGTGLVIKLVVIICLGLGAYSVWKHGLDEETIEQMATNAIIVIFVLIASNVIDATFSLPYWEGVLAGWGVGSFVALGFIRVGGFVFDGKPLIFGWRPDAGGRFDSE